ncbi:restriction endonuclease subunit S [Acinetobacter faecalis]|uniref:restriction endonuclease subunit S n=1 Tax=Acinetobacter faecalis TaxID=2665161 RepID=UPI002A91A7B9|nr:restriction endonuclease subunit S [Acinetobacter faecalis]MDY6450625.1 restriction endonuclease subunit S [Acinetobacter faecalis]
MAMPKLRFKEFNGDWSKSKIGEIFDVTSGATPLRSDARFFENATIPWVKTTDLNNSLIILTEEKISEIALKETSVKILPKDTVFVAMYGGFNQIGRTGLLLNESACNQALSAIYPNEKINSFFLLTYLNHKVEDWKSFAASSRKDPNITKSDVLAFPLIYPSKEEQTKIASFLSAVDKKISQLTQKHELLSQYKQGMMQKLFSQQIRFKADDGSEFGTWENISFLSLMNELWDYRGRTPKKLGMDWGNGEIQSLSALNIKKGFIDFEADCHLGSEELYKVWMNKGDLVKDDIIFTMEAPLGNVALIPDNRKYILSQRVVCFKTNQKLVFNPFLFQLILSDQFQNRIDELATGTTAKGINQKSMQKIEVQLPSLEEQTKIANFLSAIDQKIEVVAQQIEQAKTWKKGLLQQMFV